MSLSRIVPLVCLVLSLAGAGLAQPAAGALALGGGRATIGANLSVTAGPDDPGFFNYTDYDRTLIRVAQGDLSAALNAGPHVSLLGAVRLQNTDAQVLALYLRLRPWHARAFDLQMGVIPPTFGSFSRRAYGTDNPLVGEPLAYQYLTSLRASAAPATAAELARMRGRGWLSSFSVGDGVPAHGLPLVSASRWDTGVQAHAVSSRVEGTVAVTVGSLSNPLFRDDNDSRQIVGRLAVRPVPAVQIGLSMARGGFATRDLEQAVAQRVPGAALTQQAYGADGEFSVGYLLIRVESVVSLWHVPTVGGAPLRAAGTVVEARYKLRPGLYVAGRADTLRFSDIVVNSQAAPWDAPVRRFEIGGGYSLQRNLIAKLAFQDNARAGGRVRSLRLLTVQLVFWL